MTTAWKVNFRYFRGNTKKVEDGKLLCISLGTDSLIFAEAYEYKKKVDCPSPRTCECWIRKSTEWYFLGKVQTMSKKNINGTNQGIFTGDVSVDRAWSKEEIWYNNE